MPCSSSARYCNRRWGRARSVSTRDLPIGGGRGFPTDEAAREHWVAHAVGQTGVDADRARALLDRYGSTARLVLEHEASFASEPLADAPDHTTAEIDWIARNERVVRLEDITMRRTALAVTGRLSGRDLERIAEVAGAALGWSDDRREAELRSVQARLTERHRLRLKRDTAMTGR